MVMGTQASLDVCDAFVKGIYGRMFIWMVNKINSATNKPIPHPGHQRASAGQLGFETFDINR